MKTIKKPFPSYKWRWAVFTPTESLNDPPTFIGILRILRKNESKAFSSQDVFNSLKILEEELQTPVNLGRTPARNIFRNSQQYWKIFGLLQPTTRGQISLTNFGRAFADGQVSQIEFATTVVKTLELPNRNIETNTQEWLDSDLKIKPLELILRVISCLASLEGKFQAYLTPEELIKVIIPLSGSKISIPDQAGVVIAFRQGELDVSDWEDCAPASNDKRMAREFLLFLDNYGFCQRETASSNYKERYYLSNISISEIEELARIQFEETELDRIEKLIKQSQIPANIQRKRVVREVLDRPNQNAFRKLVLEAYRGTCIITGVSLKNVLEAAHIKPVKYRGPDSLPNGFCLRSDIHSMFDSNHLKIYPDGTLLLSKDASSKENYPYLPPKIKLPNFIDRNFLDWRIKYYS